MKKKLLSVMLGTAMAATLITGCGGSGNSSSTQTSDGAKKLVITYADYNDKIGRAHV